MSTRNIIGTNIADGYYHVSIKGKDGRPLYNDEADYRFFQSLFGRYLAKRDSSEPNATKYGYLYDSVEVLAYCLMPTYFYLLVCQISVDGLAELVENITDDYSEYFHAKYGDDEPLFDAQPEASFVDSTDGLLKVTRHIHLTPPDWMSYPHSSLAAYLYGDAPKWLMKDHVAQQYGSAAHYLESLQEDIRLGHEMRGTE